MLWIVILAACFVAYSNGANDNFKGVASLFGSRTTTYWRAMIWATVTTFAGSIAAISLAQGLLQKFSGRGLVPPDIAAAPEFLVAVAVAAGATVILATIKGFPVSTTHALMGAIVGSGLAASQGAVNLSALGSGFVIPLIVSPLIAVALAIPIHLILRPLARHIDPIHFLSAGAVSFARGLNDTPKIAALMLTAMSWRLEVPMLVVALMIAIGGLLNARKVAETMSLKITAMDHRQGLAANVTTALLVVVASRYGLPVSTTHVAVGSLFGIGLTNKSTNPRTITAIALSWALTLPCAAVLGAAACWALTNALAT